MGIEAHYLTDKEGNKFYPYAHADASYDRNGKKVGVRLDEIDDKVESMSDAQPNVQSDWNITDTTSDAYIKNKPTKMPASDVSAWAKASTKPTYAAYEVGLGNVPNVATNDQTPTYTEATTLTKLTSGEKLSIAFGKISKGITDLISHIANKSNPHGVTKAQVGLSNVGNFKAVSTTTENQGLTDTEKTNARTNIGLNSAIISGTQTTTSSADGGSNVYTFTDASGESSTITVKNGSKGSPGTNGTNGKDGTSISISSTSVTYQVSSSGTTTPTGTWSTSVPSTSAGQYLWTKTVVTYSDGKSTTAYSVSRNGTNGSKGAAGSAGIGISKVEQTTTSTSDGGTNVCTVTLTDGTTSTFSFKNGSRGSNGTNGTSAAWFAGTAITGTSTTAVSVNVSGSKAGDMYLNTTTCNVYRASAANSWIYVCCIKGSNGTNATTSSVATQSSNGLMSSTDKKKLDGISDGANKYTHPTTSGNKHIPSGGEDGQILEWIADGTATWSDNSADKLTGVLSIANGGTGASTTGEATNNLYAQSLAPGISIPSNSDLDTYMTPGSYYVSSSTVAGTISNTPYTLSGFMLTVYRPHGVTSTNNYRLQEIMTHTGVNFRRYFGTDDSWSSWVKLKFTDTTYSNFVKSGSGAKSGLVPAPSTTAGTTKYLREDGTWQTPPDTTYSSLKNPYALTIQGNGTTLTNGIYDGSVSKIVNITPASIGVGVANNCTTTASGYVLDARQGKILMDKVTSFQAGVDTIYNGCTTYGSTPAAKTPTDIVNAIKNVYTTRYSAGVADADARVNTGSYNYQSGYSAGMANAKNWTLSFQVHESIYNNGSVWSGNNFNITLTCQNGNLSYSTTEQSGGISPITSKVGIKNATITFS